MNDTNTTCFRLQHLIYLFLGYIKSLHDHKFAYVIRIQHYCNINITQFVLYVLMQRRIVDVVHIHVLALSIILSVSL